MTTRDDIQRVDKELGKMWDAIADLRQEIGTRLPWWGSVAMSALSWIVGILMSVVVMLLKQIF